MSASPLGPGWTSGAEMVVEDLRSCRVGEAPVLVAEKAQVLQDQGGLVVGRGEGGDGVGREAAHAGHKTMVGTRPDPLQGFIHAKDAPVGLGLLLLLGFVDVHLKAIENETLSGFHEADGIVVFGNRVKEGTESVAPVMGQVEIYVGHGGGSFVFLGPILGGGFIRVVQNGLDVVYVLGDIEHSGRSERLPVLELEGLSGTRSLMKFVTKPSQVGSMLDICGESTEHADSLAMSP